MASDYYEWDDNRIHYRKSGLGDPILLVHGLYPGASSEEFDHNIRALSRDFRVYAIDLLGFGVSDAPRIRYRAELYPLLLGDFIRDVIGAPAGVVAAGASGPFAARLAADEPELVSKLVFISPQFTPSAPGRPGRLRKIGRELLRMLLLLPPVHLLFQEVMAGEWEIREMLRRSFREKMVIGSGVVERLSELARLPGVLDAYASLEVGLLSLPFEPVLPRVLAPALFISGNCVGPETSEGIESLSRLPRRSRLEWIERAGEWAHYEVPNRTNRLIASFLGNDVGSKQETPARAVA
jgi:pimeloyl-ACP methyl ester carboxylesterase